MTDSISFDPFLAWIDTTDPDNIPAEVRIISASDLLRYENFGVQATGRINSLITETEDIVTSVTAVDDRVDDAEAAIVTLTNDLNAEVGKTAFVRKTADTTRTGNVTLTNDPELFLTLGPNELVEVEAVLFVSSPGAAGMKVAFTGTGVAMGRWGAEQMTAIGGATNPNGVALTLSTGTTPSMFTLRGILGAGAGGGQVALQWAQNTSNAGDTKVHSYSFLKFRTISGG